jgi:hypothetical protein
MVIHAMASDSEQLRLSVQYRLTKIEQQVAQLVLDHATLHNLNGELRRIVSTLQNFKLKQELREKDQESHSKKVQVWTGIAIALGTLIIQLIARWLH